MSVFALVPGITKPSTAMVLDMLYKQVFVFDKEGFNKLRLTQNGCHFADGIFKAIFLNENFCMLIQICLKFIPNGPNNSNPALVQINGLASNKPLSEPMMTGFSDIYMCLLYLMS